MLSKASKKCNRVKFSIKDLQDKKTALFGRKGMTFDFKKFEKEAREKWKKADAFVFKNDDKNPYYILEQFPYPSGNIHMGHLRCYTIGDAIARFRRLQGYSVLHPFGFDAFGLPAENAAIDNNINPSIWTYENIKKILSDLDKLGMSIDHNRIIATCEPEYYKHEQKMFLDFVKNGIAYQKESVVNWDPVDHTVLANEQVIDGKGWRSGAPIEKKKLKQWYLRITKYADDLLNCLDNALPEWPNKVKVMQRNWIDKSYGALIKWNIEPTIELNCKKPYFDFLKNGSKTIEILENLPKYQTLKVGDLIKFNDEKDISSKDTFLCQIIKIDKFENIQDFLNQNLKNILPNVNSLEEGLEIYNSLVKDSDEYGFLGIHVKSIPSEVEIFTTRPDTLFGGSFIGLSPFHPLAKQIAETNNEVADFVVQCEKDQTKGIDAEENKEKKGVFTGINCKHPLTGESVPLWLANFVLMDYGTGAVFGCPAHDERDREFWEKYGIKYKQVIDNNGKLINSGNFNGLACKEAREKIVKELEKNGMGKAQVMYKLRDWGVSRQRYWGCPIPMVYCDKCGCVPELEENLPIILPKDVKFDGKGNPLDKHPTWKYCKCPVCGTDAIRETDTFDTFFESSWYFFRYLSPKEDKKPFYAEDIKNILPVQDYVGGIEHAILHLLYSRFFTKALADCNYFSKEDLQNLEPFKRLITQGMVLHEAFKDKNGKWIEASKVIKKDGECYLNE